jgi:hypothetical protein
MKAGKWYKRAKERWNRREIYGRQKRRHESRIRRYENRRRRRDYRRKRQNSRERRLENRKMGHARKRRW